MSRISSESSSYYIIIEQDKCSLLKCHDQYVAKKQLSSTQNSNGHRKIDIFSAIYINIKVVTTTNSKIGLQRSLQNLMLDFSTTTNLKSAKNSAQKMILNLVFLFHSTVQRGRVLQGTCDVS